MSSAGIPGRRQAPSQRIYRQQIGSKTPTRVLRVGFNPRQKGRVNTAGERFLTGLYPQKGAVDAALSKLDSNRVQVRVYGAPAWDTTVQKSPPPNALGNVYVTYHASKQEIENALRGGGTIEDVIFDTGGYAFDRALTVYVGEA